MKQYHYLVGNTQMGPFGIEELRTRNLTPDTLVWAVGMESWLRAGDVPELSTLFMSAPPRPYEPIPQPQPVQPPYYQQPAPGYNQPAGAYYGGTSKPKNWLVESILVTLFCCLPLGITGIIYSSRVDSAYAAGDINGALKASEEAGRWVKIGFFAALGLGVLYFLLVAAGIMTSLNTTRY